MSEHACMWPGCEVAVPAHVWGCDPHWATLPADLKLEIRRTWSVGYHQLEHAPESFVRAHLRFEAWIRKTFGDEGRHEKYDPGKWERLVAYVRARDAARAARRAVERDTRPAKPARPILRLVP